MQRCGLDLGLDGLNGVGYEAQADNFVRMVKKAFCCLLHPSTADTTVKAFIVWAVVVKLVDACCCHQRHYHWLPVRQRVDFKLALLVYKALHDSTAPC